MPDIVAALFDDFKTAESALGSLRGEGFAVADTTTFFLNAGGRHAHFRSVATGSLGKGETRPEPPLNRPAGVVVAAHAPAPLQRERAISIFRRHGAHASEEADGKWKDGTWQDFDPVSIPDWRKTPVE